MELKKHIQEQKKSIDNLNDVNYKQDLFDQLNYIEDKLDARIK